MVQQGGLEIVIVIKSRDMTVIRYARLLPIDHRLDRVLREGERATVVIRLSKVVLIPEILVAPDVPLVCVGVQ